jgi:hypothetical protein
MTGDGQPDSWRINALQLQVDELRAAVATLLTAQVPAGDPVPGTGAASDPAGAPPGPAPGPEAASGVPLLLAEGEVLPWSLRDVPVVAVGEHLAWLEPWVEWVNTLYGVPAAGHHIPTCWPDHPGLAAELLTLMYVWHNAFASPGQVNADAAQDWHNLHLPAVLARSLHYVRPDCLSGHHEPHQTVHPQSRHRPRLSG